MKTIWILNHYAMTPEQGGGTRHYNFALELVNRGYKVYVFSSSYIHNTNINTISNNEEFKEEIIGGINWVWIKTHPYSKNGIARFLGILNYYFFMTRKYSRFEKPDVVIGSSVHPFACLAGITISKKTKSKCISEIRDLWPQTLIDMEKINKNNIISKILYRIEKYIYKQSEEIIVTAPGMSDYIENLGFEKEKIVYINNGVDTKRFEENKDKHDENVQTIMNESAGKFKCMYTGALGEANNIENLIFTAKLLRDKGYNDIIFIIVGDGPERKRLVRMVEEFGIDNVKFYNPIKKESIPSLLANSDINIFNLKKIEILKYGISANKLFDYMCSAKPIIFACETKGDYVKDSECGISVEPENPRAIADAVIKLYNLSKEERELMGFKGREFVKANFDIPILVEKLEEVINL
jgi:glycosyltransferase involved in cell wall biosynthesis